MVLICLRDYEIKMSMNCFMLLYSHRTFFFKKKQDKIFSFIKNNMTWLNFEYNNLKYLKKNLNNAGRKKDVDWRNKFGILTSFVVGRNNGVVCLPSLATLKMIIKGIRIKSGIYGLYCNINIIEVFMGWVVKCNLLKKI